MNPIEAAGTVALASVLCCAPAAAQTGRMALLDASRYMQLERWLGAGDLYIDNIYTRRTGETSADFHAQADHRGPTFTLMEVTNAAGDTYLVGGYNPQSWSPTDIWHDTPFDWQRTAFLFNMTTPAVYRQVLSDYELPSQGLRQTYNSIEYGPTFGQGHDLYVNETLDVAFSWRLTYGDPAGAGHSIIDASTGGQLVRVDALEVFSIAPVPEAGAWAMLLAGLGLVGLAARRLR